MPMFSYVPVVDSQEVAPLVLEQRSRDDAVAIGRSMLMLAMAVREPQQARIAIFEGAPGQGAPIGAWVWSAGEPEPIYQTHALA